MNIFQKIIGLIFPSYRKSVVRQEENRLFIAIIKALPGSLSDIKINSINSKLFGLIDWKQYAGFKFVTFSVSEKTLLENRKRGCNFRISGISIFSLKTNKFEDVEFLVKNNFISGIRISNDNFQISQFDISKINTEKITKIDFSFPPDDIDVFYNSLDQDIKNKLNIDDIFDIEFNRKTYYVFFNLEDGNYLAVDKNQKVYSLVHDAKPMSKLMKISFLQMINKLSENNFNKEKHLEERYSKIQL